MTFSPQIPGINIVAISGQIDSALRPADKRKGATAEFTLSSSPRANSSDSSSAFGSVGNLTVRVLLTHSLSQRIANHLSSGASAIVEGELTGLRSRQKRGNQTTEVGIIAKRIHLYGKDGRLLEFDADKSSLVETPKAPETSVVASAASGGRSSYSSQKTSSRRSSSRKSYSRKTPTAPGRSDRKESTPGERKPKSKGSRGRALDSGSNKPGKQQNRPIGKPISARDKAKKGTVGKSPFEIEQTTESFDPFLTETSTK